MQLDEVRQLKIAARSQLQNDVADAPPEAHVLGAHEKAAAGARVSVVTLGIGRRPGTTLEDDDFWLTARIRTAVRQPAQEARIRATLTRVAGQDFDLRHTGPVLPLGPAAATPTATGTLKIGASISRILVRGGSLGFFARSRGDNTRGFVSANHVIANFGPTVGIAVVTPSQSANRIGELVRSTPLGGGGEKHTDAAFAKLDASVHVDRSSLPQGQRLSGAVAPPKESSRVMKVGAGTMFTPGNVTSFDNDTFSMPVHGIGQVNFDDQIEVESAVLHRTFAANGDSGSLVYNNLGHAVGLLFAVAGGLAYVNPMQFVLDELQVDLDVA